MPTLPNVNQVLQVVMNGPAQNKAWLCRQYLQYTGSRPALADLNTLANTIKTQWGTVWAPQFVAGNNLTQVTITDLTDKSGAVGQSTGAPIVGTRVGSANPVSIAAVSSWKINRRYRGGHPRTYWPAGAVADIVTGFQWSGTFVGQMVTQGNLWRTNLNAITMNGGSLTMVNVSYYLGKDATTGKPILRQVPVIDPIIQTLFHPRIDSMRRRTGKETP